MEDIKNSTAEYVCQYAPYIRDYPGWLHKPYQDTSLTSNCCLCSRCGLFGTQYCNKLSSNISLKMEKHGKALKETLAAMKTVETPRPANVQAFEALAHTLSALYARKNTAYGDSFAKSIERYGKISALTRMSDKWNRLENLMLNGGDENDESLTDTLLDLASYCIMTIGALHNHEVDDVVKTLIGESE